MKKTPVQTAKEVAPARGRGSATSSAEIIASLVGSDRLLDLILNNTSDLIVILDRNGRRIYNSPSYREVLGDPDALRGTIAFAEIHPEDRDQIQKLFQQTVRTGKGKRAEFRFLLADGSVRHIESRGYIIRDVKREIRYVVVISRDITSQRHTRMQLAESEATFRGLVENSFVGVFIMEDARFTYVNPRFCEILGYGAGDLIGRMTLRDVVVSEDRKSVEENIQRHLAGETSRIWYAFHALRKDSVTIDLEIAGARTIHDGRPAIIGTVVDITERKRAESLRHALYSITERASSVTNLGDFYAAVHGILGEFVYVRNFYIALYDRESGDLTFPYFVDEYDPPPPPHKQGRGLTEYVLRTGKPLLATPEVFQDLVDRGEVVLMGGASVDWLGVPLMKGETAVGVIVIQSYTDTVRFGRKEQEILTFTSRHIAGAIDRKRTEAALRESEERHRAIIAGMGNGVLLHDAGGTLSSWNPGALRILDPPGDDLARWPYRMKGADPIHEDGSPFLPEEYPVAVTRLTGSPCTDAVLGFRTRTGDRRWISINTQPLITQGGDRPCAVVTSFTDITRRKEAEDALYRSEQRFRSLVEAIPDWIWETDAAGRYTYASPKVKDLLGFEPTEVLGKRPRDFMQSPDAEEFGHQLMGFSSLGEAFSGIQKRHVTKDGRSVVLETSGVPVFDDSGKFRGYRGIDRDMTNELEMERRLRQSQKMESLGQLAGGIAHDFNNVLGVIQGGLALLQSRVSDQSLMRYIDIAQSAVNRGADVASRLLMFSREGQVELRPLSFAEVADELTRVLEHSIEKTIEIVTEIPPDLPIVQGDSGQLYQMLLNLCINSRDAIIQSRAERTGRITIAATTVSGEEVRKSFKDASAPAYVRVSVRDTGSGMTDEVRARIFEPFFTTKPPGKGTGLGLAVVYGIVKSHLGFIDLESAPGKGTTFHIYLVAYPEEKLTVPKSRNDAIVGGSETILVVEDEEALRNLVTELLRSYGYSVLEAEDGVAGLEMYTRHRDVIRAVITDMGLPRMSGQDLFARIREVDPSTRVVLASGYLDPEMKSDLFGLGAKAFLQKPYQPADILRVIRGVIDLTGPTLKETPL